MDDHARRIDDGPQRRLARLPEVVLKSLENDPQQRTMLRLSLEAGPEERAQLPLRQGRVIKWLEEALERTGELVASHLRGIERDDEEVHPVRHPLAVGRNRACRQVGEK